MDKINLDEILLRYMDSNEIIGGHGLRVKAAMKEAIKIALQLAVENAKTKSNYCEAGHMSYIDMSYVDKDSITTIINQIE